MVEIDNYTPLDYNHWVCTKHDIIIHVRLTIYLGEVSMFTIKTLPFRYPPFLDRPNWCQFSTGAFRCFWKYISNSRLEDSWSMRRNWLEISPEDIVCTCLHVVCSFTCRDREALYTCQLHRCRQTDPAEKLACCCTFAPLFSDKCILSDVFAHHLGDHFGLFRVYRGSLLYGDGSKPCTPGEPQNSW